MSSNFSWFLRFVIYIPLTVAIFITVYYSYLNNSFEKNFAECSQQVRIGYEHRAVKDVANFVGCLKSKGNFFTSAIMREERLFQYAQPKMQCEFIGSWYVSDLYKEYWINIDKDGRFFTELTLSDNKRGISLKHRSGVWSSTDHKTAIIFYDDEYFWPIREFRVSWLSDRHFVLTNILEDKQVYFYRKAPMDQKCNESQSVTKSN